MKQKKALIFGAFDIIHPGHLSLIAEAKKYGEVHAGLALDETIQKIKGREPFNSLEQRKKNLEQYVTAAHAGDRVDRMRVVREVSPDVVVLGYDQVVFVDKLEEYARIQAPAMQIIRYTALRPELFSSSKIRAALEDSNAGFLLIDKPSGEPSLRTVAALRRITGIKQIGFAGTLDPLASGLLICGISKATTLLDWFHMYPKTYEAEARLGVRSDTYDATGSVTNVSDARHSRDEIVTVARSFVGDISQTPPMFSAKKIAGKKMYELARKGLSVERKPQNITIHALEILTYEYPTILFRVTCSSGTYVRSIVHDMGEKLGVGAVMTGLRRTAIGPYKIEDALNVADLRQDSWLSQARGVEEVRERLNTWFWQNVLPFST